jgi:hypothetical protein
VIDRSDDIRRVNISAIGERWAGVEL